MSSSRLLALLVSTGLGLHAAEPPQPNPTATTPPPAATATSLVQWRSWSDDLPAIARQAGKPIYVFAGSRLNELTRATWRQSFASEETAAFLNQHFVCVQIDMDTQGTLAAIVRIHLGLLRQTDGLPVHLWLSPELQLLEAMPYLPPTEEWGKPGFLKVATQVNEAWQADPKNCGAKVAESLEQAADTSSLSPLAAVDTIAVRAFLDQAAAKWRQQADAANGGFGDAPKYAQPELLRFLLTRPGADQDLAVLTLRRIANSTLRDPLDGGFFKYATDPAWKLPLFQKLLVDQARIALAFLDADAVRPDPVLRDAARGALDYALTRLALPGGGFALAEDGTIEPGSAAYLWSAADLAPALGGDAAAFAARHQVKPEGNLTEDLDPGSRWKGLNILASVLPAEPDDVARLARVAALRKNRPAPVRDDRAFAGPQALLLAALARASIQLQEPRYDEAADRLHATLRALVSESPVPSVRRLGGADEPATPTDLAALALGFRAYGRALANADAEKLADTLLRKLVADSLDQTRGDFVVPVPKPAFGFLAFRAPALAEPCEAEALALLAGLGGREAALLQAGIVDRVTREDGAGSGPLLLALAVSLATNKAD